MALIPKHSVQDWQEYRRQMLEETSRFIEWGLRNPHLVVWIPAKPADKGGFPRQVAAWFWAAALSTSSSSRWQGWREFLLRRGRGRP